ncbi:MAG: lytic transglycosylase domain-containing protein [Caldimonas sp.]
MFSRSCSTVRSWRRASLRSGAVFLRDAGHGLLEIGHNSLALLGLLILGVALFATGRPDVRHAVESETLAWLQARQDARVQANAPSEPDLGEPDAIARATASDPRDLSRAQASVAMWLSRRYHVAPEPVSRLVQEAWTVGALVNLDPTLILAVMAVESSFNPFAESPVGAQGLMQVMTKIHDDKYLAFGGSHAAFDPVTNLRVGVQVLKECIARGGSLEAGLRYYVGAANSGDDGGYAAKVLAEQSILRSVAGGAKVRTASAAGPAQRVVAPVTAPAHTAEPLVVPVTEPPAAAAAMAAPSTDKVALLN